MKPDPEGKRDEALGFLVNHDAGVLSTVSREGQPRSRLLYYACDDAFNIYFLTFRNTRKVDDLEAHPKAAFVVSELEEPRTIQIEGTVADLTETAALDPLLTGFVHRLMEGKEYGIPLSHFDTSVLKFYRLAPTWVRWGDFLFAQGTDAVLTTISPEEPSG